MRPTNRARRRTLRSLAEVAVLSTAVSTGVAAQVVTTGTGAAGTLAARDQLRVNLGGGTVPGAAGLFGGVRREINWDAVPDVRSAPNALPLDFFNTNSPRGAVFTTPGSGVQVSASSAVAPINFATIDPSYATTFAQFSPQRLFTPIGSNVVDVSFFVAGTATPGIVRGFGSVFSDVDLANTTSFEFFNIGGGSLGKFFAPAILGDATLSFLGVEYANPIIHRVRITNGNAALGAGVLDQNGAPVDLVVMDDFIYSEPLATPEPATLVLMATGLVAVGAVARRRARRGEAA